MASLPFELRVRPSKQDAYFTTSLSTSFTPAFPAAGSTYPPVSPLLLYVYRRYRNFRLLSITYASRPQLRSRLTRADEPSPGNLGFSTVKILTSLSLLIPAFSLLPRPHVVPVMLLSTTLRSPTNVIRHSAASVDGLAPYIFGAGSLD